MIRFSVVTVTYQAEATVGRTLESVLRQRYPYVEHLIVDGASTDATLQLVDAYRRQNDPSGQQQTDGPEPSGGHEVVVVSEPDRGLYDAMNKALARVTGDYVVFLNAGDTFPDADTLENVAAAVGDGEELPAVLYGDTHIVDAEGHFLRPRHLTPPAELSWRSFANGMLVCHQAFYARTDVARTLPYDLSLRYSADVDWCIRVMKEGERRGLALKNVGLVVVNFLDGGLTTRNHMRSLRERFTVMRRHYGLPLTLWKHLCFVRRALLVLLLLVGMAVPAVAQRATDIAYSFAYDGSLHPSCHASTLAELPDGSVVAAWFGGSYEGCPDVCIYTARLPRGSHRWTELRQAADGVFIPGSEQARQAGIEPQDQGRKACYNPVLYQQPDGPLLLFYKIGRHVQDWTGWLVTSADGGLSFGNRRALPEGCLGPVKNKPERVGERLLCPSSTEKGGWKIHFESYRIDAQGHLAEPPLCTPPIAARQAEKTFEPGQLSPIGCIQPSILRLADGRLQVLCRTQNARLATSYSADGGQHWTEVELTQLPNNNSGTDAVTLSDGRHLLVCNPVATPPGENGGPRSPLAVLISDDGTCWRHLLTLESDQEGEYSYPAIIQAADGTVHISYTWRRQRICHVQFRLEDSPARP